MANRLGRLISLHKKLSEGDVIFESASLFDANTGELNRQYRAIIKLSEAHDRTALESSINSLREQYIESNKKNKYPDVLPKFVKPNVSRIHIHKNDAYYSKTYTGEDKVILCKFPSYMMKERAETVSLLSSMGYRIEALDIATPRLIVAFVDSILEKHCGSSIRYRRLTGSQYRANYFRTDDSGELLASKLSKIGVMLIPHEQNIEVSHSTKRKKRSDSVYNKKKPIEIAVPYRYGDIYLN